MQHSPLETRTWAALSVPAPTAEGSWIGQVSEKASRGKKGPCAAHLPDKRFNQPALRTPHPLLALGTSRSQPPQLPVANIPLHQCDGPSLRGRAMIELEVILIITHLRHMQPFGARVKSISLALHICGMRRQWSGGLLLHIHTTFNQHIKKYNGHEIRRMRLVEKIIQWISK